MPVKQDSAAKILLRTRSLPAYFQEGKAYIIVFNKDIDSRLLHPVTFTEVKGIGGRLIMLHHEQDETGQNTPIRCFSDLLTGMQITKSKSARDGWQETTRLLTTHNADFEAYPAINSLTFQRVLVAGHSQVVGLYAANPFVYEVIRSAVELGQPLLTIEKQ